MDPGGGSLGLHTSDSRMAHTMIMQDFGKAFSLLYFLFVTKYQNSIGEGENYNENLFLCKENTFVGLI